MSSQVSSRRRNETITATGVNLMAELRPARRDIFQSKSGDTRRSFSPAGLSALNSTERGPFFERRHRGSERCRHENTAVLSPRSAGWARAEFKSLAAPADGIFHVARKDCRRY